MDCRRLAIPIVRDICIAGDDMGGEERMVPDKALWVGFADRPYAWHDLQCRARVQLR